MTRALATTVLAVLAVLGLAASAPGSQVRADDLFDEFDVLCLAPEGDEDLTWAMAVHKGYSRLEPSDFEDLRVLAFARELKGMSRTVEGVEYRVLTARGSMAPAGSDYRGFYQLCWVSAGPADYAEVRRLTHSRVGLPSFTQGHSRVMAWVETPEGREPLTRNQIERRQLGPLMVERDVRMVTMGQHSGRQVMLGYMRRRDRDQRDVDFLERHGLPVGPDRPLEAPRSPG